MEVLKKMGPTRGAYAWSTFCANVLLALLEQPDATIADVLRMFSDRTYRREVARSLRNETVRTFLEKEFERFSAGYRSDGIAPIQNKIGAFLADPTLNRILTRPRRICTSGASMDEGQVLLVNLGRVVWRGQLQPLGGPGATIGLAAFQPCRHTGAQRRDLPGALGPHP